MVGFQQIWFPPHFRPHARLGSQKSWSAREREPARLRSGQVLFIPGAVASPTSLRHAAVDVGFFARSGHALRLAAGRLPGQALVHGLFHDLRLLGGAQVRR